MLDGDSGMKAKLLEKILEMFAELPDKEDEAPIEAVAVVEPELKGEEEKKELF